MTREVAGRLVISCDRCNARLDLGPATRGNQYTGRSPSGWLVTGQNEHVCALCSPAFTSGFIRRLG